MILEIVKYGDPVLRKKGARVDTITREVKKLVGDMLETMREAKGAGLAAQQVGQALQLAVIDVRGITDRPSTLEIDGKEAEIDKFMPLVLINPEIKPYGESVAAPEGCLSFPEMYSDIARPGMTEVNAINASGEKIVFRCGGLLSRAVQHEVDHLNGILFIDRMSRDDKTELKPQLETLQAKTKAALKKA